ncbi:MAG: hypothetical protein LBU32_22795 [Clostridiales bacterium]|nr:hypothetical protein [Clostridiales bacterium]
MRRKISAMLCLLKTGSTWRDITDSFPNWLAVCCYFRPWSKEDGSGKSAIEKALYELMPGKRIKNGRNGKHSMIIVDSRGAENADTAEINGNDGEKRISQKVHASITHHLIFRG